MTLKQMLGETAKRYTNKIAIIHIGQKITYAELDEASNKVANTLITLGVKKGDRVATLLTNSLEMVVIFFGIVKIGAIATTLDVSYKCAELVSIFENCKPKILVTEDTTVNTIVPLLKRFNSIQIINVGSKYKGKFLTYQEVINTGSEQEASISLKQEDIATISYTGGPTSHPRGAAISHRNVLAEAKMSGDGFEQSDKDIVMLFALPLYHNFGLVSVLLTSLLKGSSVVIIPGTGRSISGLLETIEGEKGTMIIGVPYIFALANIVAKREGIKRNLSSLRLCVSGGAPLPIEIIQEFQRYYGLTLFDCWGLTEAVSQVTCPPIGGPLKLGSVGKPLPGRKIRIVDADSNDLKANQPGEVLVSGPLMECYYNNPQDTARVMKNGWMHTGDLGKIDEEGYLFLTGRKKEIIIQKGQNVYPQDIEEILRAHPKVAGAKVVGIPDTLRGEIVAAVVALKPGEIALESELRQFCQDFMADYKLPKRIVFTYSLSQKAFETKESIRNYFLAKNFSII